jgi:hypothetical protein
MYNTVLTPDGNTSQADRPWHKNVSREYRDRNTSHLALLEVAGDTTNRELKAGLGALGHRLLGCLSLAASGHDCVLVGSFEALKRFGDVD